MAAALRESEDRVVKMTLAIAQLVEHSNVLADQVEKLASAIDEGRRERTRAARAARSAARAARHEQVRALREQKKSLRQIADILGVTKDQVSKWMRPPKKA